MSAYKKIKPVKDKQTVTPAGERIAKRINGLTIRPVKPQVDQRGELVEIYDPAWKFHAAPLVFAYQVTLRPGSIRGWVVHKVQEDRIHICFGVQRWVFYDDRRDSPTHGLLNQFVFTERNRALFAIPTGVYHAVQNIGEAESMFINLPTHPYNHADPDKYRLPLKNDLIPFDFNDRSRW